MNNSLRTTSIREVPRSRYLQFALLVAASLVVWGGPCWSLARLALSNEAYTHILLVVPVTLALAYIQRADIQAAVSVKRWPYGFLLVLSILIRILLARHPSSLGLTGSVFALVLWWIGSIGSCFGMPALRSLFFPLLFLFFVVPAPQSAVDWLTVFLQHQSAAAAAPLFRLARIPVLHQDTVLLIPGLSIEVAKECSSIRSSTILLVITVVLAQLFLNDVGRKVILVALAIPVSIAKNAARIFVISTLGTKVNPGYLHGNLHRHGGVLFLLLGLAMVVALLLLIRLTERPE